MRRTIKLSFEWRKPFDEWEQFQESHPVTSMGVNFIPVVGGLASGADSVNAFRKGNYWSGLGHGAMAGLSLGGDALSAPIGGWAGSAAKGALVAGGRGIGKAIGFAAKGKSVGRAVGKAVQPYVAGAARTAVPLAGQTGAAAMMSQEHQPRQEGEAEQQTLGGQDQMEHKASWRFRGPMILAGREKLAADHADAAFVKWAARQVARHHPDWDTLGRMQKEAILGNMAGWFANKVMPAAGRRAGAGSPTRCCRPRAGGRGPWPRPPRRGRRAPPPRGPPREGPPPARPRSPSPWGR
jgi:hypothetical protein